MLVNLLVTEDTYYKNKIINNLKDKYKEYEYVYIELDNTNMFNVLEELNTYQIFSTNKLVVLNNIFSTSITDKEQEEFINYLKNPNDLNVLLILDSKIDRRKKFPKDVIKYSNVFETKYNLYEEVENHLEEYTMDSNTIRFFINYLNEDINLIINELNKLKIYKIKDKTITIQDIEKLVTKKLEDNIFELTNEIMNNNIKKAISIYNDLINNKEETTKLLLLVANQFSLLLDVKRLARSHTEKEITTILKVHPYRVKLALQNSRSYELKRLEDIVINLSDLDYKIKSGNILKEIAFEIFLAQL